MSIENTIFRGLASLDGENTTTELLRNLMQYKYIRDIILKFLIDDSEIDLENISSSNISTQRHFKIKDNVEIIADLVIENKDIFVIIENKTNKKTKLQASQVSDYVNLLNSYKPKKCFYIFLFPDDYKDDEIKKLISDSQNSSKACNFIEKKWSDLLKKFSDAEIDKTSKIVSEIIEYFYSVIDLDLNTSVHHSLYQLSVLYKDVNFSKKYFELDEKFKLTENIRESLVSKLNTKYQNLKFEIDNDYKNKINQYQFGSYIKFRKNENQNWSHDIWVGCVINEKKDLPELYFTIRCNSAIPNKKEDMIFADWYYYKLNSTDDVEKLSNQSFRIIQQNYKSIQGEQTK